MLKQLRADYGFAVHDEFSRSTPAAAGGQPPLAKEKSYRIWNEVPTLLMIIVVVMAVAKPI